MLPKSIKSIKKNSVYHLFSSRDRAKQIMHDLNDLVKLLDGDVNVQKQVIQSIQPKNEPFEFRFNGHANSLTNTEINSFSKALAKLDYTRILTLTHQKDFISTDVLATLVESSRCLRQLDISYGDILDFSQLFQAINSDDGDDAANQKGDLMDNDEEQKCLQSLNISGNHLKFDDAKLLGSQLEKNSSLLALRLKSCSMKIDSIIRIIEGLYKNNTLESLDLSRQDRSVDPYNLSCHIQKYFFNNVSTITRLNLRHLNLTDQCVFNITTGLLNGSNSLKHLDVSNNMLSRDSAKSFVKLLKGHPLETLNISYNRLENEGLIEILNCLDSNDNNSTSCSKALSVLIAKTVEASGEAWTVAKKILSAKNATLREFYIWGNCFKNQIGAAAIKYLIDERRYRSGRNIDVQPYVVDDVIWMAENGDSGRVAEDTFHEILDSDHY